MTERQIKRGRNEINKLTDEGEKYFSKPAAEDSSSSLADLEIWDVFALVKPPPPTYYHAVCEGKQYVYVLHSVSLSMQCCETDMFSVIAN